jgi:hypothetical protein
MKESEIKEKILKALKISNDIVHSSFHIKIQDNRRRIAVERMCTLSLVDKVLRLMDE